MVSRDHQVYQRVSESQAIRVRTSQTMARYLHQLQGQRFSKPLRKVIEVTRGGFMKNQMFALIGLGLLLATASAYAQTGVVKANVPFNFIVNKTELPAGQYRIQPMGVTASAMAIESQDAKVVQAFLPIACASPQAQKTTKLVFHRYGSHYFLAQIWKAGNDRGQELPMSGLETEVARDYPAQSVVVVATLR
jgi:hypothetical protein